MKNTRRRRQNIGYFIGLLLGLSVIAFLSVSWGESYLMPGPSNVGHEDIQCNDCHIPAKGSFRQQIQANVSYLTGKRPESADFGRQDVTNNSCLACHHRPDDRHPVFRFFEPRYKEVREQLKPQFCISCHLEHTGKRVTLNEITYCQHCHKKLVLKQDPISVSHADLIRAERWETCLGCHDFHGNHIMTTAKNVAQVIPSQRIIDYFQDGDSPYSDKKYKHANKEPHYD